MVKSRVFLGMVIPPLIGNPYNGYINPYYWVDEFIPYYMEMSWELIDPIAHMERRKFYQRSGLQSAPCPASRRADVGGPNIWING